MALPPLSLPAHRPCQWASVADYWVIGVDEKTTDRSLEVIEAEMGHLPGHVVITRNFDGMGPAWTELVEVCVCVCVCVFGMQHQRWGGLRSGCVFVRSCLLRHLFQG